MNSAGGWTTRDFCLARSNQRLHRPNHLLSQEMRNEAANHFRQRSLNLGAESTSQIGQGSERRGIAVTRSAYTDCARTSVIIAGFHMRYCSIRYVRRPVPRSLKRNSTP